MNYFDDLSFSMSGSVANCVASEKHEPLYYGIQFNYHGPLRLKVGNGREYRVDGPYAFLTYPGVMFEYGSVNGMPRHHNFLCSYGERIEKYLSGGLFVRYADPPLVRIAHPEQFLQIMTAIMALTHQVGPLPARAVLLFEDLLLRMHESAKAEWKNPPYQAGQLNALIAKICAAPEGNWNFRAEAEKCHVTPTHFRRLFKKLAGMPPQQFLIQNRLRKGADLLISSRDSVKEIADRIGMEDVFYFSRLFRLKYQASPLEYRKEFSNSGK